MINLINLFTCFSRSKDFQSALNKLQNESLALKRATKLAELATSSVDGFKNMLQEKLKIENELKKSYSKARLRWIRAINRVLIQNYVERVKIRLLTTPFSYYVTNESSPPVAEVDEQSKKSKNLIEPLNELKLPNSMKKPRAPSLDESHQNQKESKQKKSERKSLDNSQLSELRLSSSKSSSLDTNRLSSISTDGHEMAMRPIKELPSLSSSRIYEKIQEKNQIKAKKPDKNSKIKSKSNMNKEQKSS